MKQALFSLLAAFASPALAETRWTLSYTCDIDGAPGELIAEYETLQGASEPYEAVASDVSAVIETATAPVFYSGKLTSPDAVYVFTGQNQFAEFTDLATHARFIVQMTARDGELVLTANPDTPEAAQYLCRTNGS